MFMIVGLGNPGLKYHHTRHNAGFDALDMVAKEYGISMRKKEKNGITGAGVIAGEKVLLVKPQTFMNNSGECVGPLAKFYKIPPENVIVISDDVTLDYGRLRIRRKGSAGGHNGLKSIIAHLGTENFPRIRVGVGVPKAGDDMIAHVLGKPKREDQKKQDEAAGKVGTAAELIISGDFEAAMNQFNGNK